MDSPLSSAHRRHPELQRPYHPWASCPRCIAKRSQSLPFACICRTCGHVRRRRMFASADAGGARINVRRRSARQSAHLPVPPLTASPDIVIKESAINARRSVARCRTSHGGLGPLFWRQNRSQVARKARTQARRAYALPQWRPATRTLRLIPRARPALVRVAGTPPAGNRPFQIQTQGEASCRLQACYNATLRRCCVGSHQRWSLEPWSQERLCFSGSEVRSHTC